MPKKTVEEELNDFLDIWKAEDMTSFFNDFIPLIELYKVRKIRKNCKEGEDIYEYESETEKQSVFEREVLIATTAYLMVKFAEKHAGRMVWLKTQFKGLPDRMNKIRDEK